jgi:hypothetical protein
MRLITLVGEQLMPIILPLWQYPGRFDSICFVHTGETKEQYNFLKNFVLHENKTFNIIEENISRIHLYGYSVTPTYKRIRKELQQFGGRSSVINITGGTKPMSIGSYLAANKTNTTFLYVRKDKIFSLLKGEEKGEYIEQNEDINIQINVDQYLRLQGYILTVGRNPDQNGPGYQFEDLVCNCIRRSERFNDVQQNVIIHGNYNHQSINNEFDVVFISNGKLGVCSCKSGNRMKEGQFFNQAVDELNALVSRKSTGLYCAKVLACGVRIDEEKISYANNAGVKVIQGISVRDIDEVTDDFRNITLY